MVKITQIIVSHSIYSKTIALIIADGAAEADVCGAEEFGSAELVAV